MNRTDSLGVELKISDFKNFDDLLIRSEQIVCNDSFPKIIIKKEHEVKTICLWQLCTKNYGCILPVKMKNRFIIHNDSIFDKIDRVYQPLDSLKHFLKRDINNRGTHSKLSDHPNKLIFEISYENHTLNNLLIILDQLTDKYEDITNHKNIIISLKKRMLPPPKQKS